MSFHLPLFLLLLFLLGKSAGIGELNVGTTLFTRADKSKECWSSEHIALLTSRMILEDLLPSTSVLTLDSNEYVSDLVEYFRMILETVRKETHGKTKHLTLEALTDLLGGYLHHAVLPIAKNAYYAGLIDYDSMATLLGLFDELKVFLRTNGQGWAKALIQNPENFDIQKIPLEGPGDTDQCDNIIFVESDTPVKEEECDMTVPMPFFDSINQPNSIALPTKISPLHNVESNASSYLVMKFFITSFKCLKLKKSRPETLEKFQNVFSCWIDDQIIPRLTDEKFYSAFGGVLRIRATLRRLGASPNQNTLDKELDEFRKEAGETDEQNLPYQHQKMSKTAMILTAILITLFVWFILGTMFICYKMRASRKEEEGGGTSTTLASSKYFYPEKPKPFKKTRKHHVSSTETDDSDDEICYKSDEEGCYKNRKNITVKMCRCAGEEEMGTTASGATGNGNESSSQARLASITEISESSNAAALKNEPSGSKDQLSRVQTDVYMPSETDTEETSEPA